MVRRVLHDQFSELLFVVCGVGSLERDEFAGYCTTSRWFLPPRSRLSCMEFDGCFYLYGK